MDWLGFSLGLLLGWLTAVAVFVVMARGYTAWRKTHEAEMRLGPFLDLARQRGTSLKIEIGAEDGRDDDEDLDDDDDDDDVPEKPKPSVQPDPAGARRW